MKHRVLSLVLVLMLCLSLLPVGALAAEEDVMDILAATEVAAEEPEAEEYTEEVTVEEEAETLLSGGIAIDETNFPDDSFRGYLSLNYDDDGNGYFSEEEIAGVLSIRLKGYGEALTSLKGIEYFTELIRLECYNGRVTELDVSRNKKLERLNCNDNLLTKLDVSKNPELTELSCNNNQLTALDVSNNPKLTLLSCNGNSIPSLNLVNNEWLLRAINQGEETDEGDYFHYYYYYADYSNDLYINVNLNVPKTTEVSTEAGAGGDSGSSAEDVAVDEENFPDAIFREYVSDNFDTDGDNLLSEEEIAAVSEIKVREMGITSLAGVEYFTNLRQLQCPYNEITELDLSSNTLLYILYCGRNKLTELNVSNTRLSYLETSNNQLTELDLSGLEYLDTLYCSNNNLTSLDVSGNTNLLNLSCDQNPLKTLDVSKNAKLHYLYCARTELTSLDVSANTELTQLGCWGNELTTLDVSKNTKLEGLQCGENKLTSLDVSGLTALEMVRCGCNQLTSLNVKGCTALDDLICSGNRLTTLDVSDNTALLLLECAGNGIERLDICNNPALLYVFNCGVEPEQYSSVDGMGEFYDWLCYFCEYEDDYANLGVDPLMVIVTPDGEIVTPEIVTGGDEGGDDSGESGDEYSDDVKAAYVEYIVAFLTEQGVEEVHVEEALLCAEAGEYDIVSNMMHDFHLAGMITELPMTYEEFAAQYGAEDDDTAIVVTIDEEHFPDAAFREYVMAECDLNGDGKLSEKDIAEATWFVITSMEIEDLTGLKYFTELENLDCGWNNLTSLDVSANTKLESLSCGYNALTELDVTMCPNLQSLYCSGNAITKLDISKNPELMSLYVMETELTELDLEGHEGLVSLDISFTPGLADLDTSTLTELTHLACCGLGLTEINLSAHPELRNLDCADNYLTELDLSLVPELEMLSCSGNMLTSLDLSVVPGLSSLWCYDNEIKTLNIADNEYLILASTGECEEWYDGILLYTYEDGYFWADMMVDEGTVFVLENIPGDADGDGTVNVIDLVVLMKSVLKMDGADVSLKAGDLNGDEKVDILDIIRLVRELAKNAEGGPAATG